MIVVMGCGILGRYILRELSAAGGLVLAVNLHGRPGGFQCADRIRWHACDVRSLPSVQQLSDVCADTPLTVFYLAAAHNIDRVFEDPLSARHVNVDGLQHFLSSGLNIQQLIFASTDCVYGENTPHIPAFPEDAALAPVNEYGRQKTMAESLVLDHGFTVARLPFLLGSSLCDTMNFFDKTICQLQKRQSVEMIDGMIRSVIAYKTAAQLLLRLVDYGSDIRSQIFNVCGDTGFSKYAIGCMLADYTGQSRSLVHQLTMDEGQKFFKDQRAYSAVMDNAKLKRLLGIDNICLQIQ